MGQEQNETDQAPQGRKPQEAESSRKRASFLFFYIFLGLLLLLLLQGYGNQSFGPSYEISYSQLVELLEKDGASPIERIVLGQEELRGKFRAPFQLTIVEGRERTEKEIEHFTCRLLPVEDKQLPELLNQAAARGVDVVGEHDSGLGGMAMVWILSSVIFLGGLFLLMRLFSPGRQVMSFGKSRAKVYAEKETAVTFDQVAGIDEAKEELLEIVGFLKDPSPYQRVGARIPRGILLVGPPGTGKTLLARAVAGEASVVFFSLSGSDFVEMFAGVGASRVRDLFDQAQQHAPCIVFIDELDALGKVRGVGLSGAHDEREQTLNQLLSEMDGFDPDQGVIILAATNRPEILDPALLRPGRFDRQVVVDRPDVKGREAILRIHAAKIKLGPDIDLAKVARETPGLVGADLANVVNEAALLAGRRKLDSVGQAQFSEAIQRSLVGLERKGRIMAPHEKERIAIHEVGHALTALSLAHADPVSRVSIVARGVGALGYTMQLPTEDRHLLTKAELEDRLAVLLGGRSAELLVYGDTSTGASDDLTRATGLARSMVREFGMSQKLGPLAHGGGRQLSFLGQEGEGRPDYSNETAREIDEEVRVLVTAAEERVADLLSEREQALLGIAQALFTKEVVLAEELEQLMRDHGAEPAERATHLMRLNHPAPSDEAPGDEAPGDEAPSDEAPGDEAPSDEAPGDEAPGDS